MKNNRVVVLLSSIICLLPLILSAVIYNDLPEQIAIQWGADGNPQNFVPRTVAAFGMPLLLAGINIFSKARLLNNPKRANVSQVAQLIMLWVIPVASLVLVPVALFIAMGVLIPIAIIIPLLVGIIFILYGNYLPKNRQNYVIGIKIPWTLNDADNWNKTHRMAGFLWVLGGIILIVQAFALFENAVWLILSVLIAVLIVIIPFVYSYALHRKTAGGKRNADENTIE
jgi:uncharacterized membrane protein